jgi:SPX domain protein involved in polyphosphate accumulation
MSDPVISFQEAISQEKKILYYAAAKTSKLEENPKNGLSTLKVTISKLYKILRTVLQTQASVILQLHKETSSLFNDVRVFQKHLKLLIFLSLFPKCSAG